MKKNREPYPPRRSDIRVGFGHCEGEWYLGVQPPIGDEQIRSIGGEALNNWISVEGLPGYNGANLLKATVDMTELEASNAGINLTLALGREFRGMHVGFHTSAIEMAPGTAPFQNAQPKK